MEKERAERLREVLTSEGDLAFHVGDDRAEEQPAPAESKSEVNEKPKPEPVKEQKAEESVQAKAEEPAMADRKPEEKPETKAKPAPANKPVQQQRPAYERREPQRREDGRQQKPRTDRPQRPADRPERTDRPQQRPVQGGYQPKPAARTMESAAPSVRDQGKGRRVTSAGPSQPGEVLGFGEVPSAGDVMNVAEVDKLSRQVAEERRDKLKAEQIRNMSKVSLDDLFSQIEAGNVKDLNIIVKADVQGTVEAIKQALEKLSNDEVRVRCIHGGVGAITGSDIVFASASNALVIGFNVRPDATAREAAEREKVDVRTYSVIYNVIEDVENAMKGLFAPVYKEVALGTAEVRNTFKVSGVGTIAGAYVKDGKITRSAQVRVVRGGIVLHDGKIASLKRFKDDVKEVASGYECGIGIENFNDIREGDMIEAYTMEQIER